MPAALRATHDKLDKAVIALYGWKPDISESAIVANLMALYQKITGGELGL